MMWREIRSLLRLLVIGSVGLLMAACGGARDVIPPGTVEPDRLLFERGTAALNDRQWATAREYFRQLWDGYPQSSYRAEAKLGLGDTHLGQGGAAAAVLGITEFQEFLAFYPTHPRADYAQFKLAMAHHQQMAAPQRDQTETREAIREFNTFFDTYPNSPLVEEAQQRYREARDRLSESEYRVGLFYYRQRWYPGAVDRFEGILKEDPQYSGRDAVYYHLGETFYIGQKGTEALGYFQRLMDEFEQSEYLDEARARIAELAPEVDTEARRPE